MLTKEQSRKKNINQQTPHTSQNIFSQIDPTLTVKHGSGRIMKRASGHVALEAMESLQILKN